ncbi:MAG TPA: DUF6529 family protein [Caulobacteraceae bacterium]|nr:DUF6529 family protein [Caulobacteraceae bacterium]
MQTFIEAVTLGHVSEVKVVLASALAAAAVWQAALMAVGWGAVRVPFLQVRPAAKAHRALGDAIVVVALVVSALCLGYFGVEAEESDAHAPVALALLGVLAVKIAVVRGPPRFGFLLPPLGVAALVLFIAAWATAAAPYLG